MKNIRIRVTGEGRVEVSAPPSVPASRITAFVRQHEAFITRRLQEVETRRSAHYPVRYADGDEFSCLGQRMRLHVQAAPRRSAVLSGSTLMLRVPEGAGAEEIKAQFIRWAKTEASRVFSQRLAMLLPQFTGNGTMRLSVRAMTTRWGSINLRRRTMSLSVHLLRCDIALIDYVITHELCHLACPHHTKAFYAALEARCPERAQLDAALEAYGLVGF